MRHIPTSYVQMIYRASKWNVVENADVLASCLMLRRWNA